MGLYVFSLSAEEKSIFFTGESDILSVSMADAACMRVSKTRRRIVVQVTRTCLDGVDWSADIVRKTINEAELCCVRQSDRQSLERALK